MAQVSVEEKRLKQLKQQLFGKEQPLSSTPPKAKTQETIRLQTADSNISKSSFSQTILIDPISLKKDILKIITFSFLALAIQLSLFFASRLGFINLFS